MSFVIEHWIHRPLALAFLLLILGIIILILIIIVYSVFTLRLSPGVFLFLRYLVVFSQNHPFLILVLSLELFVNADHSIMTLLIIVRETTGILWCGLDLFLVTIAFVYVLAQ